MSDRVRYLVIAIVVGILAGLVTYRLALDGKIPLRVNSFSTGSGQSRVVVSEENAVIDAVKKDSPSIVAIGETSQNLTPFAPNPFSQSFGQPSQPQQSNTIGTGFVVSSGNKNYVITNRHVVSDLGVEYSAISKDGKKYNISKIYRDPNLDLAILQVDGLNLQPLDLGDSSKLQVGQMAIAIGNALGQFDNTVTTGVISGLGRAVSAGDPFSGNSETLDNLIQTDAAINPGNSGGPLLNSAGQVIGVNVATTQGAQNIGFAIPINAVQTDLTQFSKTGFVTKPFLGVQYRFISQDIALLNEVPEGAYVQSVVPGSPAEKTGIKSGDIIIQIDGKKVNSEGIISSEVQSKKVGDTISLQIWEDGNQKSLTATLVESPNQ